MKGMYILFYYVGTYLLKVNLIGIEIDFLLILYCINMNDLYVDKVNFSVDNKFKLIIFVTSCISKEEKTSHVHHLRKFLSLSNELL